MATEGAAKSGWIHQHVRCAHWARRRQPSPQPRGNALMHSGAWRRSPLMQLAPAPLGNGEKRGKRTSAQGVLSVWAAVCFFGLGLRPAIALNSACPQSPCEFRGIAGATLEYEPRVADAPTAITFSIGIPADKFVPADREIELSLPGFTVCSYSPCNTPRSGIALIDAQHLDNTTATWDETEKKLRVHVPAYVRDGSEIRGTIPKSAGLRLPRDGLEDNQVDLLFGTVIFDSPAVGSFLPDYGVSGQDTRVTYEIVGGSGALRAGQIMDLHLQFRHSMRLANGDSITLALPHFNAESFSNLEVYSSGDDKLVASWDPNSFELRLRCDGVLEKGFRPGIVIPGRLRVASDGVALNDPTLTIKTDAVSGPVLATPIVSSPQVPGVVVASSLSFCDGKCIFNGFEWICTTSRARPGRTAEISLAFEFDVDIAEGETIVLSLPEFSGPDQRFPLSEQPLCEVGPSTDGVPWTLLEPPIHPFTTYLEQHPYGCTSNVECQSLTYEGSSKLSYATWSNADQQLTLTAARAVSRGVRHLATIPIDAAISLPESGVRTGAKNLRFESSCSAGPIPPAPPRMILGVGALQNVMLAFTPAWPGMPAEIQFSFVTLYDLLVDDVVELRLLDFNSDDVNVGTLPVSATPASFRAETICCDAPSGSKVFSFICTQHVSAGANVRIILGESLGLRLPMEGIRNAGHTVYSLEATYGWIPTSEIMNIQHVSAALNFTQLSYFGASWGSGFAEVRFTFTTMRRLVVDDTLVVRLVHFSGLPSSDLSAVSAFQRIASTWQSKSDAVKSYSWNPADDELRIVLGVEIDRSQTIEIRFQSSSGIALPVLGMDANSELLTVRADFVDGASMSDLPIVVSPQIPAMMSEASLNFGSVRVGVPTNLALEVVLNANLTEGDTISVTLPEFYCTASTLSITSSIDFGDDFNQAVWAGSGVTFTVARAIAAGTRARVTLTKQAGIIIGTAGVGVASKLTIEGTLQALGSPGQPGQFYPTEIPDVQRVGALQGSAELIFGGTNPGTTQPKAGYPTSVEFYFRAHMALFPGDTLTLHLSDFEGTSTIRQDVVSEPLNAIRRASWNVTSEHLVFTVGSTTPISALSTIKVTFPTGIVIAPRNGLAKCANTSSIGCPISLSVNAQDANILEEPRTLVTEYASIGKLAFSSLRLNPPRPGEVVEIELAFALFRPLNAGDKVTAFFGSFGIETTPFNGYFLNGVGSSMISGESIFDEVEIIKTSTYLQCILTAVREASSSALQTVIIPKTAGISTPIRGISTGEGTLLQLSISSSEGSISGEPIRDIERVGALIDAGFEMRPPSAGYITELTIDLTPTMIMLPGDYFHFFVPAFTGPPISRSPIGCKKYNESTEVYDFADYIREAVWIQESESFNLSVVREIPANTRLQFTISRDSQIAVPGSGIPASAMKKKMFLSTLSKDGRLYQQPVHTSTFIPAVMSTKDLSIEPKQAFAPVDLKIVLQVRAKLNPDTTIMISLPGFTGGRACWDSLPGDPAMALRCLTQDRGESCGPYLYRQCPHDVERYCLPFSPYLNAFSKKPFGGCKFSPKIYLGPHSQEGIRKDVGSCDCLRGEEYERIYDNVWKYWNQSGYESGPRRLPSHYGSQCWPWDSVVCVKNQAQGACSRSAQQHTSVECHELFPGEEGPHCCSSFCFVSADCENSVKWHGYRSSYASQGTAFVSYETCNDDAQTVDTCPYAFPPDGREEIASASWTEYDQLLVLTLRKPIVAFTPVTVFVPVGQNIITPAEGLGPTFSTLTVDIWDPTSNTLLEPIGINILDAVGSFHNATISTEELSPGMSVPLTVRFTSLMNIAPGETVSLLLPGFETDVAAISVTSEPSNFFLSTWNAKLETLSLMASQRIARDDEIVLNIPKTLRLPVNGLSPDSALSIITNARQGKVSRENPFPLRSLVTIGGLWNTALMFDPPVYDEAVNITFEFQPKMIIATGDSVTLTLEGFAGPICPGIHCPGQTQMYIASLFNQPASRFVLAWRYDGKLPPAITVVINQKTVVPADTLFRVVIPANCTFLDPFQRCLEVPGISLPTPLEAYDPRGLYMSVQARAGSIDKSIVRISSLFSARPTIAALEGEWKGTSYISSGFPQNPNVTHLMNCLSSGFGCPSHGAYRCNTIGYSTEFHVNGNQARLKTALATKTNEDLGQIFDSSKRGGDFSLISMVGNHLLMKNATASEYLVLDEQGRDTSGTTFCSYARAVYRVDLSGTYDVALELYTKYVFRTLNASPTNVRLRLQFSADPYFNPVGMNVCCVPLSVPWC